jgi:hypothetical protein
MQIAVALIIVGFVAYIAAFIAASRNGGATLDSWVDWLFMGAVPLVLLAATLLHLYIGVGARVELLTVLRSLFEPEPSTIFPYLACVALGFVVPASLHVLLVKCRAAWRRDA